MANRTVDLLDQSRSPSRTIVLLAMPAIIEQLLQTMVNYVDTAMVGSMGKEATAAVAVTTSLNWLVNGLMNAAGLGFSVQVARCVGSDSMRQARRVVKQAIMVMLVGGVFFTLLMQLLAGPAPALLGAASHIAPHSTNYLRIISSVYIFNMSLVICGGILRGAGDTKTPMLINILANLANIAGNFFLIFPTRNIEVFGRTIRVWGAGWGVEGAAAATAFAGILSGLLLLAALFSKKSILEMRVKSTFHKLFTPDWTILKTALSVGSPAALERVIMSSGQLALTRLINGLGVVPYAAYFLCNQAESISYLPGFGISIAATTLVGQALGAGEKELARKYGSLCLRFSALMMGGAGVLLFFFSKPLISIFTPDLEVIALGMIGLKIMAFSEPFFGLATAASGIFRGAGDARAAFYITFIGMWGVRMILLYALCYPVGLGVFGAWYAMVADMVVRGALSYYLFRKNRWQHLWETHIAR